MLIIPAQDNGTDATSGQRDDPPRQAESQSLKRRRPPSNDFGLPAERANRASFGPGDGSIPEEAGASQRSYHSGGNPTMAWKLQLLPILDHGAGQVLAALASGPFTSADQEQAYATSLGLFEETRLLYDRSCRFLDTYELHCAGASYGETARKANLATFMAMLLGDEPDLLTLDRYFLACFMPIGGELLKWQADLFLELKTEAYMTAFSTETEISAQVAEELFPLDIAGRILARRPQQSDLSSCEMEFVNNALARRQILLAEGCGLQDKLRWTSLLAEVRFWLHKATEVWNPSMVSLEPVCDAKRSDIRKLPRESSHSLLQSGVVGVRGREDNAWQQNGNFSIEVKPQSFLPNISSDEPQNSAFLSDAFQTLYQAQDPQPVFNSDQASMTPQPPPHSNVTPPDPPLTTAALYRQARLMSTEAPPPRARRSTAASRRRPWTEEEEDALLNGLDYVKGSHWSQIQRLYGAKGLISEALKDRSQVQLKDKARNLKLFFIKAGFDVPESLQRVTGEVKRRKGEAESQRSGPDGEVSDSDGVSESGDVPTHDSGAPDTALRGSEFEPRLHNG